jgi:hypothetical protein
MSRDSVGSERVIHGIRGVETNRWKVRSAGPCFTILRQSWPPSACKVNRVASLIPISRVVDILNLKLLYLLQDPHFASYHSLAFVSGSL